MAQTTVLALHGFGGSGASWDGVAFAAGDDLRIVAPDLRGHGAAAHLRPVDLEHVLDDLVPVLRGLAEASDGPVTVAGYSLGGRVGLHLALEHTALVSRVVLVSSTSGMEDEDERAARRRSDEEQAVFLEQEGAATFAERWAELPLWDGDPPEARAAQRDALAACDPSGLAAALRGLGAGAVPAVGPRLATLAVPLSVVVGGRDLRYRAIGTRLLGLAAQPAGQVVVADAGHGLLREAPAAVAAALCSSG
ncbi:alpha/beta fold hydrolase [Patulibacter minatonensis]|uniref:alpha/beta fold hydrolase n=1 Tax=Patulibacter minatonensis TaxID=298163 RepID=UPI0004B7ABB6|nr:alpha/beta fold hydrolase [Patulibacter minatonensis]